MNKDFRLDEIGFGTLKLYQDPSDFCYGVDAVILADFASDTKGKKIIDLGCGTGVIPLILSHKTEGTHITGVEFRKNACRLAEDNIRINNLTDRIDIIQSDIMHIYLNENFDTVVTNPPYVATGRGQVNTEKVLR